MMVGGPLLFLLLALLGIVLLVIGLTTFLWLPLLVIGVFGVLWLPVLAWVRASSTRGGGAAGGEPSGVPSTGDASYEPVEQPEDQRAQPRG